jgi:hypothetical protein
VSWHLEPSTPSWGIAIDYIDAVHSDTEYWHAGAFISNVFQDESHGHIVNRCEVAVLQQDMVTRQYSIRRHKTRTMEGRR